MFLYYEEAADVPEEENSFLTYRDVAELARRKVKKDADGSRVTVVKTFLHKKSVVTLW